MGHPSGGWSRLRAGVGYGQALLDASSSSPQFRRSHAGCASREPGTDQEAATCADQREGGNKYVVRSHVFLDILGDMPFNVSVETRHASGERVFGL